MPIDLNTFAPAELAERLNRITLDGIPDPDAEAQHKALNDLAEGPDDATRTRAEALRTQCWDMQPVLLEREIRRRAETSDDLMPLERLMPAPSPDPLAIMAEEFRIATLTEPLTEIAKGTDTAAYNAGRFLHRVRQQVRTAEQAHDMEELGLTVSTADRVLGQLEGQYIAY